MKAQPTYRDPFSAPGFFHPISRREAAQLIHQWRRNGAGIRRMGNGRGYFFRGHDGEDAAMGFNDPR